ncbi:MAG: hypothetical protein ACFCU4_05545 [Puniceicoccaceae bacterium]
MPVVETATVYEDGPRAGERGRLYVNIEGVTHDPFASFGYLVFDPQSAENGLRTGERIYGIEIEMTHAPSRFSTSGEVEVWLVASPMLFTSDMRFDRNALPNGIGNQLGRLIPLVGPAQYDDGMVSGGRFLWKFSVTESSISHIARTIAQGNMIHFAITPVGDSVAATFAGTDWLARDTRISGAPKLTLIVK